MKLSVSEEMYKQLKWYRGEGMYELLKWYQSWERLSWEDAEKNRPNPDKHRPIRGWYNNLSADGKFVFKRFLAGDDNAIVVKTEPSPTIKDSLESITDKLDDISDVIKGVVENLEKEVIPDNDLKYIVKFNEKGVTTKGFMYNVPTERYVSKVTFGHIELSRDLNKAVKYSSREEATELAKELNGSLDKLGLLSHGRFMSYRKGELNERY